MKGVFGEQSIICRCFEVKHVICHMTKRALGWYHATSATSATVTYGIIPAPLLLQAALCARCSVEVMERRGMRKRGTEEGREVLQSQHRMAQCDCNILSLMTSPGSKPLTYSVGEEEKEKHKREERRTCSHRVCIIFVSSADKKHVLKAGYCTSRL